MPTAAEIDEARREAQLVVLHRLRDTGDKATAPTVLALAEAYAWLQAPDQPHGGRVDASG